MNDFVHLHTHSCFSPDGLGRIEDLIGKAVEIGHEALALTDHGTLSGSIAFTKECEAQNIKPILGCEVYVLVEGKRYHLTVLCDGNEGFRTLTDLNNIAQKSEGKRPAFELTLFEKYNKGLVILSGCPASPMQQEDYLKAREIALYLKNIFGKNFYAEFMVSASTMLATCERAVKLSEDLELELVITNDVHFTHKKYFATHQNMTEIRAGYSYNSKWLYMATSEEITKRVEKYCPKYLSYLPKGFENAVKISKSLNQVVLKKPPQLPQIDNAKEVYLQAIEDGAKRLGIDLSDPIVAERHKKEFDAIVEADFISYFLITKDLIDYCKASDIFVGHGRGSAAGSLDCYLLGITGINPLEHGLIFERFLNKDRGDALPDIDTDISSEGREYVIEYAEKKYGAVPIITTSYYREKSLIRDLCRVHGVPIETANKLTEGDGEEAYNLALWESVSTPQMRLDFDVMLGQVRHFGRHAGGIVIYDRSMGELPLQRVSGGAVLSAFGEGLHDQELSYAGLVKFDILGLSTLDLIQRMKKVTGVNPPMSVNPEPFEILKSGDTLGIFQLNSPNATQYCVAYDPKNLEDLSNIAALIRKPSLESGVDKAFLAAKHEFPKARRYAKSGKRVVVEIDGEEYCYLLTDEILTKRGWVKVKDLQKDDICQK